MRYTKEQKTQFFNLSLDEKIKRTKQLILEWYLQFDGKVYVSFSGGKDSTVLLHLARSIKGLENIVGVFDDTGLEYPEIREFVKKQSNIIWLKPKLTFKQVIEDYGYPIISKEQSRYINDVNNPKICQKLKDIRLGKIESHYHIANKWKPLIDADFKISNRCCDVMKKRPLHKFEKETGMKGIVGTMAAESKLRLEQYMKGDCNSYNASHPQSKPMSFWNEQDVLQYIKMHNLEISSVYGDIVEENGKLKTTGCSRTGCMFCMFGLHLEQRPNRFDLMKHTHPKQYDYIMNKLNGRHIMNEYLKCDNKCVEPTLFDELQVR